MYLIFCTFALLQLRKEVIERKVAKKKTGRKLSNLLHARQEESTESEIRERLNWIMEIANISKIIETVAAFASTDDGKIFIGVSNS